MNHQPLSIGSFVLAPISRSVDDLKRIRGNEIGESAEEKPERKNFFKSKRLHYM